VPVILQVNAGHVAAVYLGQHGIKGVAGFGDGNGVARFHECRDDQTQKFITAVRRDEVVDVKVMALCCNPAKVVGQRLRIAAQIFNAAATAALAG
jgi:hypothetical protein